MYVVIFTTFSNYRAPELLRGEPPSTRADIYSFGITLWHMLTGQVPYDGENQHVVIFAVVAYHMRPEMPVLREPKDPTEELYQDLCKECWHQDILQRPKSGDLVDVLDIWTTHL